jgi:6-phosphofructokinase 1
MTTQLKYVSPEVLGPASIPSPLRLSTRTGTGRGRFVPEGTWVRHRTEIWPDAEPEEELLFEKDGPREHLFFEPAKTRAAVVTCGGLCPGLNNVVRSLFLELHLNYGVPEIIGIRNGYQGLNPAVGQPPIPLSMSLVSDIHKDGGTVLGSSRGNQEPGVMVDFLERENIQLLFCIGGDGTQRGAHAIFEEVRRRGRKIAVVGIPKTIDNDILFCDRTFGFVTAIEAARHIVHMAHTEATGTPRGIGLVKVMGRDAGFIACGAVMASQEVNFVLIPEVPFELHGEKGLLAALEKRMDARGHAVIVVAEGAGQHLFKDAPQERDASGNVRHHDIGPFLKEQIAAHFKELGRPVDIKYIDPSYIIRSVPANCDDSILCDHLARGAAHAAMSGRTDVLTGFINWNLIHVPMPMAVGGKRRVDLEGSLWSSVLAATGQPARFGP